MIVHSLVQCLGTTTTTQVIFPYIYNILCVLFFPFFILPNYFLAFHHCSFLCFFLPSVPFSPPTGNFAVQFV
jgi:hypothetical protein